MIKTVAATTLGCKVNFYDTEAILELFAKRGYQIVSFDEKADVYIINTCTVTNLGDKKSRQMIRRAKKQNENSVVAAIGCYAQVAPQELEKLEEINLIIGTKERIQIVDRIEQYDKENGQVNVVSDIMKERIFEPLSVDKLTDRQRAFIKIQEGCDRFCTYCIIPYARGPVRSRKEEDVLDEVKKLAANGYKEIVLTGIHVASYGKDLRTTDLLTLLKKVHKVEELKRIRMSSIEPTVVTDAFLRVLAEMPKICDHFHLSLQSGSERTLERMNRKYTAETYGEAVNALRQVMPTVAITTDVIAGFPGETEEDFEESFAFIQSTKLSKLHVFPYSPKKGTPAATFEEQISSITKDERTKKLIALNDSLENEFITSFIGKQLSVLIEKMTENGYCEGASTNYITVRCKGDGHIINQIVQVEVEFVEGNIAYGKVVTEK